MSSLNWQNPIRSKSDKSNGQKTLFFIFQKMNVLITNVIRDWQRLNETMREKILSSPRWVPQNHRPCRTKTLPVIAGVTFTLLKSCGGEWNSLAATIQKPHRFLGDGNLFSPSSSFVFQRYEGCSSLEKSTREKTSSFYEIFSRREYSLDEKSYIIMIDKFIYKENKSWNLK